MIKVFLPEEIAEEYKFLVFGDNYVDYYSTDNLVSGNTYTYYRCYYMYDSDLLQERSITPTNNVVLDSVEVETTHDYIYRKDYANICQTAFIYIIGFIVLLNIMTSIIKKGGVLSGLI